MANHNFFRIYQKGLIPVTVEPYPKLVYSKTLTYTSANYTSSGWFTSGSEENFENSNFDGSSCDKKIIIDTGDLNSVTWNSPGSTADTQYIFFQLENTNGDTFFNDAGYISYTVTVTNADNLYVSTFGYHENPSNGFLRFSTTGQVTGYGLDSNGDGDTYDTYQSYNFPAYDSSGTVNQQRVGIAFRLRAEDYNNPYSGRILIENLNVNPSTSGSCIASGTNVPYFKIKSGSLAPPTNHGGNGIQDDPFAFELTARGQGESNWYYVLVGDIYTDPSSTTSGVSVRAKLTNTSGYTDLPSASSKITIEQSNGENLTFSGTRSIVRGNSTGTGGFNAYFESSSGNYPKQLLRIKLVNVDGDVTTTYRGTIQLVIMSNSFPYEEV